MESHKECILQCVHMCVHADDVTGRGYDEGGRICIQRRMGFFVSACVRVLLEFFGRPVTKRVIHLIRLIGLQ